MKKAMFVATCAFGYACGAHAQSSVTLYGVIDAGFAYVNDAKGHSLFAATSGNVTGSHWA
ncbi:MAG: porin [Pararobbsia sp.]